MLPRLTLLISLFLMTFAGGVGSKASKKKPKKKSENTVQVDQQQTDEQGNAQQIVTVPSHSLSNRGIRHLSEGLNGIFFTIDSREVYFIDNVSQIAQFIGEWGAGISHFCSLYGDDVAYFVSGDFIYYLSRVRGRFQISKGPNTNGRVHSLICARSEHRVFISVGNTIYLVLPNELRRYVTHTSNINQLATLAAIVFFHSDSKIWLVDYSSSRARLALSYKVGHIDHLIAFSTGHIAYSSGSDLRYVPCYAPYPCGNLRQGSYMSRSFHGHISHLSRYMETLYFAIANQLHQWNDSRFFIIGEFPQGVNILSILPVSEDLIYVSTTEGLYRWERSGNGFSRISIECAHERARDLSLPRIFYFQQANILVPEIVYGPLMFALYQLFRTEFFPGRSH